VEDRWTKWKMKVTAGGGTPVSVARAKEEKNVLNKESRAHLGTRENTRVNSRCPSMSGKRTVGMTVIVARTFFFYGPFVGRTATADKAKITARAAFFRVARTRRT